MFTSLRFGPAVAGIAMFGLMATAQPVASKMVMTRAPLKPAAQAVQADDVVVGKITEVEADQVEAVPFKGAPADQKVAYKVAVLKVDERLIGAGGVTRIRVGFPADAPAAAPPGETPPPVPARPVIRPRPIGRGPTAVALTTDMEGCFCLTRHPTADFYILVGPPLQKKDDAYAKELEHVKKVAKAISDPVTALKAKDLDDRFQAAHAILERYQRNPNPGTPAGREPIPEDENKLIVALLAELPWMPDPSKPRGVTDPVPPSRSALWAMINPHELGFKQPTFQANPGQPAVDFNKVLDEASAKFLKENGDKIRIRRFVQK